MFESMSKNYIDLDEYPQTAELHNRCVNMLARLFHAPQQKPTNKALGCGTVGSSEAIFLAVIAMKRRWQQARKTAGKSHPTSTPNLVMCSNVQVCWEKAIEYLDIEARYVHITEDRFTMCLHQAVELCDGKQRNVILHLISTLPSLTHSLPPSITPSQENTIGVAAILGSTFTGHYDDISLLDSLLTRKCEETNGNVNVPIHVDAASGGFVAPFICPELVWDFRLERVVSINGGRRDGEREVVCGVEKRGVPDLNPPPPPLSPISHITLQSQVTSMVSAILGSDGHFGAHQITFHLLSFSTFLIWAPAINPPSPSTFPNQQHM